MAIRLVRKFAGLYTVTLLGKRGPQSFTITDTIVGWEVWKNSYRDRPAYPRTFRTLKAVREHLEQFNVSWD